MILIKAGRSDAVKLSGSWAHVLNESDMAKTLIIIGIVLVAIGGAWLLAEKLGLGRLPGDIVVERGGVRVYIPVMTSLIISMALSLLLWLFSR